jgi:hypothetical protein
MPSAIWISSRRSIPFRLVRAVDALNLSAGADCLRIKSKFKNRLVGDGYHRFTDLQSATTGDRSRTTEERYRQGGTISTAYVEPINQVVSRRFVKEQHMQWTLKAAHLLL